MAKTLKLVGAQRFSSPQVTAETGRATPVLRNEELTVSDEIADHLLQQTWKDRANNPQPVWVEVEGPKPAAKKRATAKKEAPKPATRRRGTRKSVEA